MNVTEIHAEGFVPFTDFHLALPERGLVLVHGPNGSGKSATIDVVSYALWSETLRGVSPWSKPGGGRISIVSDGVKIAVERKARADSVTIDGVPFATRRAATETLEHRFGTFSTWCRAYVVSSDAVLFGEATDGARKQFLEQILGLGAFDAAVKVARTDLREVASRVASTRVAIEQARRAVERMDAVAPEPVPPPVEAQRDFSRALAFAESVVEDLLDGLAETRDTIRDLDADLRHAQEDHAAVEDGTCDRCHRPMEAGDLEARARAVDDLNALLQTAQDYQAELTERLVLARAEVAVLRGHVEAARIAASHHQRRLAIYETELAAYHRALTARAGAVEELSTLTKKLAEATSAEARLKVIEAALGLQGIRARMLTTALSALDQLSKRFFSRVIPGGSLRLAMVDNDVDLSIHAPELVDGVKRFGGGSYKACSKGERRRIDSAFVVSAATLAGIYAGRSDGDLWLDEAFDSLDDEGVETIGELLEEVARERKVVLITHNTSLARSLWSRAKVRIGYEPGGKVTVS